MNRNVHRQLNVERGVDTREPSTACFLIDSNDRGQSNGVSSNFTITSNQNSILGYFTRLGVQEISLDWSIPNVSKFYDQAGILVFDNTNVVVLDISGTLQTITLRSGFFNVAQVMHDLLSALLIDASGRFSLVADPVVGVNLVSTIPFRFPSQDASGNRYNQEMAYQLGFQISDANTDANGASYFFPEHYPGESTTTCGPNMMPFSYLDICSQQLTYCQDVKDATTNPTKRDVLHRFYFANDSMVPRSDEYGFPIGLGYEPFVIRRSIPFPKQIRWEPNQQVGNLSFQSYLMAPHAAIAAGQIPTAFTGFDDGDNEGNFGYQMTLLASEV